MRAHLIANATGSTAADAIYGTDGPNTIRSGDGSDELVECERTF